MEYTAILYRVEDRIARITLNAPEKRNALSLRMREEMVHALRAAEAELWAMIRTDAAAAAREVEHG